MTALAIALVLSSAVLHATWNLLAKRSGDTLAFLWAVNVATLAIYGLPVLLLVRIYPVPPEGWPFVVATGLIHIGYYVFLSLAYRHGALSLAYPVARGTGVALVPLLAIPLLGEQISGFGAIGIGLIVVGILVLHAPSPRAIRGRPLGVAQVHPTFGAGTLFALLTGLTISAYSLVDKAGVARVHPAVYGYLLFVVMTAGLAPYMLTWRRAAVGAEWRRNRGAVLVGGVLVLGTYLIILGAMRLAQVSYIVPLREVSVVIGAVMGVVLLGERLGRRRIVASVLVLAGVLTISMFG